MRAVLGILDAKETEPFTQKMLQALGVGQYRPTLTALRFLELVSPSGRLADDVLQARSDYDRLKSTLTAKIKRAYLAAGFTQEDLSFLGQADANGSEIERRLRTIGTIQALKHDSVKSGVRSSLRALHDVLVHDRGWLEREVRVLQSRQRGSSAAGGPHHDNGKVILGLACDEPSPSAGETAEEAIRRVLNATVKVAGVCQSNPAREFVVDFREDGAPVHAHVAMEALWTESRLRRLAKQLLDEAEELSSRRTP